MLKAKLPLEFFEARSALRIAQSAGAERYANSSYEKTVNQMNEADALASGKHENKKSLSALSREVVQTAEDAREIAVKHIDEERAESERTAGAGREAHAKAHANEETERRLNAEAATAEAVRDRNVADRNNRDAQAAAQQSAGAPANPERYSTTPQQNHPPPQTPSTL